MNGERFWNVEIPSLVLNTEALEDFISGQVQEACKQQMTELSSHIEFSGGEISICACGFDYEDGNKIWDVLHKNISIKEALLEWASDYDVKPWISDEQKDDLLERRAAVVELFEAVLAKMDADISKPRK